MPGLLFNNNSSSICLVEVLFFLVQTELNLIKGKHKAKGKATLGAIPRIIQLGLNLEQIS